MQEYVVGLLMFEDYVVMIRKAKPEWQAGRLNGVGGKIEPGEEPLTAMRRESLEEIGVTPEWTQFARLTYTEADLYFFAAEDETAFRLARQREIEPVEKWSIAFLRDNPHVLVAENLVWLLPLAQQHLSRKHGVMVGTLTVGQSTAP